MTFFPALDFADLRKALADAKLDGWLLYDFHGTNPVAGRMIGAGGMATRRLFVLLPAHGDPVAVAHKIELQPLEGFPGEVRPYAAWEELQARLGEVVKGKRLAMETFPEDGVPYLDRVPAGLLALIERLGGTVVPSAELVTRFAARWSAAELADHRKAAEALANIAKETLAEVVRAPWDVREYAVQRQVLERIERAGLVTTDPPIVAFGKNAANPHYEPIEGRDAQLAAGDVVLLDLWGGRSLETVFADQTWMGFAGNDVPVEVERVWSITRDARDAAIALLRERLAAGEEVTGADLDRAARDLITERGYGEYFVHRLGHSIDRDLHGSGPHLDSFETNDTRRLLPGIGFSVEPGIYLPGRFGTRSEVNVALTGGGADVTPITPQRDLILAV